MRNRLSTLIQNAVGGCAKYWADVIADHLLANGVIVPPLGLGQICFVPYPHRNEIDECRVTLIAQKANGSLKIRLTNLPHRWVFEATTDDFGETLFLTREEAEKELERRVKNG